MFVWVRQHKEGLGAGLLFFILALIFHWHSVLHPLTSVGSMTDELLLSWTLDWNAKWFAHPEGSLFDTPFFAPHARTLAYTEHVIGLSLLAWPVTALSDTPLLSYNLLLVFSTLMMGWCTWRLARELGAGFVGALIAGMITALAPPRLLHAPGHVNILSQWWIPLSVYYFYQYLRTHNPRAAWFLGASVLGQGLVSPQGLALQLTALAVVGGTRWCIAHEARRRILAAGAAVGVALLFLIPVVVPYVQTMGDPAVLRPPWLRLLLAPSLSELLLPPWMFSVTELERNAAPGLMPLILFLGVIFMLRRRGSEAAAPLRILAPFFLLMAAGILLALGPAMTLVREGSSLPGVYAVLQYVPGFSGIRAVGRFSVLTLLGLAVVIGVFWEPLTAWRKRNAIIVQAVVCALLLAEFWVMLPPAFALDPSLLAARPVDAWLSSLPRACMVAEVPFKDFRTSTTIEESARFIYYTRYHGKRIVNGYAGAAPRGYFPLEKAFMTGQLAGAFDDIRAWGAEVVVVHPSMFTPHRGQEVLEHLRARTDVEEVARFPGSFAFRFLIPHAAACVGERD